MLKSKMAHLSSSLIGVLGFSILSSATYPLPSFAQVKTYQCAWYKERVCVGQTIRGDFMSGIGTVRRITDYNIQIDDAFFQHDSVRFARNVRVGPPPGSYQRSCQNFRVVNINVLDAECWTHKRRRLRNTSLIFWDCASGSDIANNNGNLVCNRQ